MKNLIYILFAYSLPFSCFADPQCKAEIIDQSQKLLEFHFGEKNDNIHVADDIKELHAIVNPKNKKQKLRVFETWGYIYKGEYRIRLIYYISPSDKSCTLMGQEILEFVSL